MTDMPDSFATATQPLPTDQLDDKAREDLEQLQAKGYEVQVGLTTDYAEQILRMSQEPAIREYCPKDSAERFRDKAATEKWLSRRRAVFLLLKRIDNDLALAGYGWSGLATNSEVPGGQTTFALRVGEIGHGQGLATPFSWLVIVGSRALYGVNDFWLETWASNGAAVHIYHKLGFETVGEVPGHRHKPDGEKVDDTRIYMRLDNQ